MLQVKVRPLAATAIKYLAVAKGFAQRYLTMPSGLTKHDQYDGVVFRSKSLAPFLFVDALVLPVYLWAVKITSRDTDQFIGGRAAHIREQYRVPFSRDVFNGSSGGGFGEKATAQPPAPSAFGEPMPAGTSSFCYNAFTGQFTEGYVALRSERPLDYLFAANVLPTRDSPMALPTDKFWVDVVVNRGGSRITRLSLSEDWLRSLAPGHDLVSRANAYRFNSAFSTAASNGQNLVVSVQVVRPLGAFDTVTNNCDAGACNVLTLYFQLNTGGTPVLEWSHLWDRDAAGNPGVASYQWQPPANYIASDFPFDVPRTGTMNNTAISTLEMTGEGGVFGVRAVTSMAIICPTETSDPGNYNGLPANPEAMAHGQTMYYVKWAADGTYSENLFDSNCTAGVVFYDEVDAGDDITPDSRLLMLAFLGAFGVQNESRTEGATYNWYQYRGTAVGRADTNYLFLTALNYVKTIVLSGAGVVDGTLDDIRTSYTLNGAARTGHFVAYEDPQLSTLPAAFFNSQDTNFVSLAAREASFSAVAAGQDTDVLSPYVTQNLYAPRAGYVGGGKFVAFGYDTTSDKIATGFFSMTGFVRKPAPGAAEELGVVIGDQSIRTVQYEQEGGDSALVAQMDDGVFISIDGASSWEQVFPDPDFYDAAYISNDFVIRLFNKSSPIQ